MRFLTSDVVNQNFPGKKSGALTKVRNRIKGVESIFSSDVVA